MSEHCAEKCAELSAKYEDVASLDRLAAVQAKTDKVKAIMQDNVDQILANSETSKAMYYSGERTERAPCSFRAVLRARLT